MRIEELWREMEKEARSGAEAWVTRYALPAPTLPLLVALEPTTSRRSMLLPLSKADVPPRRDWPACRGLEVFTVALSGQAHLGVRLLDPGYVDVFTTLAEDVAQRVAGAENARSAASVLLKRLGRWQRFLAARKGGLSPEQQRGLYGELHTLRAHLLSALGSQPAVKGWRAPKAAHQDFQFSSGAIEVKTTTAKQPQAVRVTSERQLDDTGIRALFLHVVVLDEREVEPRAPNSGESLPEIVNSLRARLAGDTQTRDLFDDRLLDVGYLDADATRYESRRFAFRREATFHVRRRFPRLTERDLPDGVGDVSYDLSVAACGPFTMETKAMVKALATPASTRVRTRS